MQFRSFRVSALFQLAPCVDPAPVAKQMTAEILSVGCHPRSSISVVAPPISAEAQSQLATGHTEFPNLLQTYVPLSPVASSIYCYSWRFYKNRIDAICSDLDHAVSDW